jgi:ATP-binding cassette, subfamily F, member 3
VLDFVQVSKAYGFQVLLDRVFLRIGDHERIGLVGANGSGKTTILRLIVGLESPDEGALQMKKNLRIGYLPQEIQPQEEGTVLDEVLGARPEFFTIYEERRELEHSINATGGSDGELQRKAYVDAAFEDAGGDTHRARAEEILGGLGFASHEMEKSLSTLSGGWHMRVRLARLLLAEPELLLLDEPTNHLDLPSMLWFEQYLRSFSGSYVIIAHDREFLNRTIDRTVEVDRGQIGQHSGNYDFYRQRKAEELDHQAKNFRTQQAKLKELEDFIARNRVRKDRAKQVQSRIKMLDKIVRIEAPKTGREIGFRFPRPERSGAHPLRLNKVVKRYGELTVLQGLDLSLPRGEKVAIIGVNGMGKSTILKIAAGTLSVEDGERELGHNTSVGYFAQHQLEALDPEKTVLDEILTVRRDETISQLRSLLGAFLFSGDDVEKKITVLSGGEKSRVALAKLLMRPANLLIMDEPTNHLDIASREMLEDALQQYDGSLLFASHDRRFIDAVATRVLELGPDGVVEYLGNYSYYIWKRGQNAVDVQPGVAGSEASLAAAERTPRDDRRERKRREAELRQLLYRDVRPLQEKSEALEMSIAKCEASIVSLERDLGDPELYLSAPEKAREKATTVAQLRRELEDLLDSWEVAALAAEEAEETVRAQFGLQGEENA